MGHFFDLLPVEGDRAMSLLVHCWFVWGCLGGAQPSLSFAFLYLPLPRESLLKTYPKWESLLLPFFSLCLVWGGKNILNVMICLLHAFDVYVGLRH